MFLIKDKEVLHFLNKSPMKTYEKFAQAVSKLSTKQLTIQEIWSIFLSLHGFVSHYLRHVISFEEVKEDRKSTRLNSSDVAISCAVFSMKKKNHTCSMTARFNTSRK